MLSRTRFGRSSHWLVRNATAVVAWASVAGFILLALGPALLGQGVFLGTDVLTTFSPWRDQLVADSPVNAWIGDTIDSQVPKNVALATSLGAGTSPWWNPYVIGGTPLGAIPNTGLMSPMSWAWFVVPASYAPVATKLLEVTVAVVGMTLLVRRLGLSARAGAVGGLVYISSGFMIAWTNWQHTRVAALIPLAFWATDRLLVHRRWRDTMPLALIVMTMLMLSFPAVVGFAGYAIVAYAAVRLVALRTPWRAWARALLLSLSAGVLGLALCAWQLVPFAFEATTSVDFDQRAQVPTDHLAWQNLGTSLVPQLIGDVSRYEPTWLSPIPSNPIESFAYLGVGALVLVVTAIAVRPRRGGGWLPAYLGCGLLAFGWLVFQGGTALGLVQNLPIFSNNFVGRSRSIIGFFAAAAAAYGYHILVTRHRERLVPDAPPSGGSGSSVGHGRETLSVRPGTGPALVALLRWGTAAALVLGLVAAAVHGLDLVPAQERDRLRTDVLQALIALAAAAALVALAVMTRRRWATVLAGIALPLLVLAQAVPVTRVWWPVSEPDTFYPATATHQYLLDHIGHDRYVPVGWTMLAGTSSFYGLRAATGHSFHTPEWRALLETADADAMNSPTSSAVDLEGMLSPIMDRMAVRYGVVDPYAELPGQVEATGSPAGTSTYTGRAATADFTGPVRGVQVIFPLGLDVGDGGTIRAQVVADDGTVLAETSQPVASRPDQFGTMVALAAEDVAPGTRAHVELSVVGADSVVLQSDSTGAWFTGVVRPDPDDGLRVVQAGEATVIERTHAAARVRFAGGEEVLPDEADRLRVLASGELPLGTVVLENAEDVRGLDGTAVGTVSYLADEGGVVRVGVDSDGPGWVVFAEGVRTRGWGVEVDGVERPLVDADQAMGAVYVDGGTHLVEFRYQPPGLRVGAAISASALGLVLISLTVITVTRLWRRRPTGGDPSARPDECGPDVAELPAASVDRT